MAQDLSLDQLHGVSETLLIPLFCRIWEHERTNPLIQDSYAHALGQQLLPLLTASPSPFHQSIVKRAWNPLAQVLMGLRTRHFDKVTREFIAAHPDAQVVMLGCGLDSRYERLGCPDVDWYNLDLPPVIELRRQLFDPQPRVHEIAKSVLDESWLGSLDPARPTLFLAEGLLMYLPRDQIRQVFRMLAPWRGLFVTEVASHWATKLAVISQLLLRYTVRLSSGTGYAGGLVNAREPASWHPQLRYLREWTYFDDREPRMGITNLSRFTPHKYTQWIVHYALGGE